MERRKLSRRALLRGCGGAAVALPWLEAMTTSRAHANELPKRFVTFFTPNGTLAPGSGEEANFQLAAHLTPLEPHRQRLLLLTGFNNQVALRSNGDNHQRGIGCLLTAAKLSEEPIFCQALCDNGTEKYVGWPTGPSLDQVLAQTKGIGDKTRFQSLELGVGVKIANNYARLSYSGASQPVTPEDDPHSTFARLFGRVSAELRARRRSVLDSVLTDYQSLRARVGRDDRLRLESHLDALREIETSLTAPDWTPSGTCQVPPIHRPADIDSDISFPAVGRAQMDMLAMALACDLTRIATLQWGTAVSNVRFSWLPGVKEGHHDLSHYPDEDIAAQEQLVAINRWYASQFAYFLSALAAIPEGDGSVLDNTVILWANELSNGFNHTLYDMFWVLGGNAGGYFKTGRMLRYLGDPHSNLLVSIANAMGHPIETFGDPEFCTGPMARLRG